MYAIRSYYASDEGYVAGNLLQDKLRKNEGVSATVISILINIALAVMT